MVNVNAVFFKTDRYCKHCGKKRLGLGHVPKMMMEYMIHNLDGVPIVHLQNYGDECKYMRHLGDVMFKEYAEIIEYAFKSSVR